MIYFDLFSGAGGFAEGLKRSGFSFAKHYYSEIDKDAIALYRKQYPNAELVGDVQNFIENYKGSSPDLLTFGSPCQDISVAGNMDGLKKGSRSKLFLDAVEIIKKHEPTTFIFENVKGLISSQDGRDFATVIKSFADLGNYDIEWQLVNTKWLLPQNRERIFVVGHLRGSSRRKIFPVTGADFKSAETGSIKQSTDVVYWKNSQTGWTHEERNHVGTIKTQTDYVRSPLVQGGAVRKRPRNGNGTQTFESRKDNVSNTITSVTKDNIVKTDRLHRLTAIENERLQGFTDNWTKYGINEKGDEYEISATARQQLMGNAVTVDIVHLIASKLQGNKFVQLKRGWMNKRKPAGLGFNEYDLEYGFPDDYEPECGEINFRRWVCISNDAEIGDDSGIRYDVTVYGRLINGEPRYLVINHTSSFMLDEGQDEYEYFEINNIVGQKYAKVIGGQTYKSFSDAEDLLGSKKESQEYVNGFISDDDFEEETDTEDEITVVPETKKHIDKFPKSNSGLLKLFRNTDKIDVFVVERSTKTKITPTETFQNGIVHDEIYGEASIIPTNETGIISRIQNESSLFGIISKETHFIEKTADYFAINKGGFNLNEGWVHEETGELYESFDFLYVFRNEEAFNKNVEELKETTSRDYSHFISNGGGGIELEDKNKATKPKGQDNINKEVERILKEKNFSGESFTKSDIELFSQYEPNEGRDKLYSFFTPVWVSQLMYELAEKHGYKKGGNILEQACGTGNILEVLKGKGNVEAFETNPINHQIAELRNPQATVLNQYFETALMQPPKFRSLAKKTWLKNFPFDLVIGNPPYGKYSGKYASYFKGDKIHQLETFFMLKGLELLKKGGLLVYITGSNFMRNGHSYKAEKDKIGKIAELVDARRLPKVFKNTQVPTDIIVLRKL